MTHTGQQVTGVRIELTYEDGTTREVVRLTNIEPTSFRVETDYDSIRGWGEGPWIEETSTGYARVQLDAFGRLARRDEIEHEAHATAGYSVATCRRCAEPHDRPMP